MDEEQEKQELIEQMGSTDNYTALAAVEILREREWLFDGSLRGADLHDATLYKADLSHADLSGANLQEAELGEAELDYADLSNANLSGANLWGTSLRNTNLEKANLKKVDAWGFTMAGANLSHVNLEGAMLRQGSFREANFYFTTCDVTIFTDVDLSGATNLDTVQHKGPSTLDVNTLYNSKGKIPEIFLRGCGVPEDFIEHTKGLFGNPIEFYRCFISHSHEDKLFARRVHDRLQGEGIRCWLDEHAMLPGDDIRDEINKGIHISEKMLLCCSKHSLNSSWVEEEIDTALEKEERGKKETGKKMRAIIPLDIDGYLLSDECKTSRGPQIRSRLAAKFKGWERDNALFETEIEKVIKALRTDDSR